MVVVALQHLGSLDGDEAPVHLNVVLPHEAGLPGRVTEPGTELAAPPQLPAVVEPGLLALLPPEEIVLGQDPPVAAGLSGSQQVPRLQE